MKDLMTDLIERVREVDAGMGSSIDLMSGLLGMADEIERLKADQITAWKEADDMRGIAQEYKKISERLEGYCRDYAEMTGIILNVSDEQREAFNKALLRGGRQ